VATRRPVSAATSQLRPREDRECARRVTPCQAHAAITWENAVSDARSRAAKSVDGLWQWLWPFRYSPSTAVARAPLRSRSTSTGTGRRTLRDAMIQGGQLRHIDHTGVGWDHDPLAAPDDRGHDRGGPVLQNLTIRHAGAGTSHDRKSGPLPHLRCEYTRAGPASWPNPPSFSVRYRSVRYTRLRDG